jgi:hypothetical protein
MRVPQTNFAKGEIAPELYARFDVAAYASAAKRARNVRVMKYGGLTKRMGTRLVAEVADASQPVRLLPFQFSLEQTYALEMGQGYMRAAANGGMVLEEDLAITGITSASQAVVASAYHGFAVGDQVYLTGGLGEMGELLNHRFWKVVSVPDAGHYTINADTRAVAFSGWEGGITRTAPPDPPEPDPVVPPPVTPPLPPVVGGGGSGTGTRNPNEQIP